MPENHAGKADLKIKNPRHEAALETVRQVAAKAAVRSAEIDAARAFPEDLFQELNASGVFYALAPEEYGGLEMSQALVNEMIVTAARAYGSAGWMMMVGVTQGPGFGLLPKETSRRLLANGMRPTIRGAIAPKGVAVPVEGGFTVSGQWPFASGGPNPDYIAGNCLVFRDGKPSVDETGIPDTVICLLPAEKGKFLDTWHVLGMRGTDSCDIAFKDTFVPADMAYNIFKTKSFFDTPHARLPLRAVYALGHAAVAIGVAQGALDDITELAHSKRPSSHPGAVLADDSVFRHFLGESGLRAEAARAALDRVTDDAWTAASERRQMSAKEIMTIRSMSAFITVECVKIVDWAFTTAGSHSVYDNSPLQRRLRDIHVATQHAQVHTDSYRVLGAAMMGAAVSPLELF